MSAALTSRRLLRIGFQGGALRGRNKPAEEGGGRRYCWRLEPGRSRPPDYGDVDHRLRRDGRMLGCRLPAIPIAPIWQSSPQDTGQNYSHTHPRNGFFRSPEIESGDRAREHVSPQASTSLEESVRGFIMLASMNIQSRCTQTKRCATRRLYAACLGYSARNPI